MLRLLTRSRAAGAALAATGLVGAGFLATTRVEAEGAAGTRRESVVIIGGGAAGLSVASQLVRKLGSKPVDVVIVEPSDFHYYQPGWTLVGGGVMSPEATRKPMADVAPAGAQLIKSAVSALDPDHNGALRPVLRCCDDRSARRPPRAHGWLTLRRARAPSPQPSPCLTGGR